MSAAWSVLVTGPVAGLEGWVEAAGEAGWEAHPFPLLAVEPVEAAFETPRPDWIAVTSSNALPALARARTTRADWSGVPLVCVGDATAERARELDLCGPGGLGEPRVPVPGAQDAAGLAATLLHHAAPGARVLWPRGERARDLGQRLRAGGLEVDDPIVYRTRPIDPSPEPPRTDAVFFASPSAVAAWAAAPPAFRPAAIALGWTTHGALEEHEELFSMTLPLVLPSRASFQDCLRSFVPSE